jgi:hypothetical protein
LTSGRTYAFKVEARNAVGYSLVSVPLYVLTAIVPRKPTAPATSVVGSDILTQWTIPEDGGSSITGYTIRFRQSDTVTFTEEVVQCNGLESGIVETRQCTVSISTFVASPYSIDWGQSIYAQVAAINVIGTGEFSEAGNGAVILTNPAPPTNLANIAAITRAT